MFRPSLRDNFPDDFDSPAYQQYRPQLRRGLVLWLRQTFPRLLWMSLMFLAIGAGFVGALFILPPRQPQIIIVTAQPSPTPLGDLQGGFPPEVRQVSITLPAKIDNTLTFGEKRGYRFFLSPELTWVIQVIPLDASFDPRLILYNPDGTVAQINDNRSVGEVISEITFQAAQTAQYGILIEGVDDSAGRYTLSILPLSPQ